MTVAQPQDHLPAKRSPNQAARARKRKQQQMDADAVGIRIDGVEYVINPHDLTGRVEFQIRERLGMGLAELHERLERSPGLDYLGMFMWAVKHANGEDVDLMDVLDTIRGDSDVEVMKADEAGAAVGPKASGGKS